MARQPTAQTFESRGGTSNLHDPMRKPENERSRASWSVLMSTNPRPFARMAAFVVVFIIALVVGIVDGVGPSALAIASIAGGVASIVVDWAWGQRSRRDGR